MDQAVILGPAASCPEPITCFEASVPAGFPSPALDHMEQKISLDALLDLHAAHTYLVRVSGDSMTGVGIYDSDVLVVSRARDAAHGDIVVAAVNGEVFVKRLHRHGQQVILMSENPKYAPRHIMEGDELMVWGVVRHSIRWHCTSEKQ